MAARKEKSAAGIPVLRYGLVREFRGPLKEPVVLRGLVQAQQGEDEVGVVVDKAYAPAAPVRYAGVESVSLRSGGLQELDRFERRVEV